MHHWKVFTALLAAMALGPSMAAGSGIALVQPSGETVPANLLRLSIHFEGPSGGAVLRALALRRADGTLIEAPFLEQELWSRDGRVLTVLLHPGRIKQGLRARDELGPALLSGDDLTLTVDGLSVKHWHVDAPDVHGPTPSSWTLSVIKARSRQRLVVVLDEPIDGLSVDHLAVRDEAGRRVEGAATLERGETVWTFTPLAAWRRDVGYSLVARGTLEDPSGNRLGGRFETVSGSTTGSPVDVAIPFVARP